MDFVHRINIIISEIYAGHHNDTRNDFFFFVYIYLYIMLYAVQQMFPFHIIKHYVHKIMCSKKLAKIQGLIVIIYIKL